MPPKNARLERPIESVWEQDCETPEDVAMGLCYAIQENVRFPFDGTVIGEMVRVIGVEEGEGVEVIAVCERLGRKYRVRLVDVEVSSRLKGVAWIDAYRQFRRG